MAGLLENARRGPRGRGRSPRSSAASRAPQPLPTAIVLEPANGGLAFARALVRHGVPVRVLATGADWYAARSAGTNGVVVEDEGDWLAALQRATGNRQAVVFTGADRVSEFLVRHRAELPDQLRAFERSGDAHAALMDKQSADRIARAAGVRVPWTVELADASALEEVAPQLSYPCVVKPALSHRWCALFGPERVLYVSDPEQLHATAAPALAAGLAMLVSEYVPGGDDHVEEAILVRAADGSYPLRFGCRKLRQWPPGFGASTLCITEPLRESLGIATRVLDRAGFVGVAGVETKRHAETGERYFIEVNVRLPAQFRLGDAAGADASWRAYATLAGIPLGEQPPVRDGVKLLLPELEMRALVMRARGEGYEGETWRSLLRSYRGVREAGLLDPRDPRPGIAFTAAMARRVGRKLLARAAATRPA